VAAEPHQLPLFVREGSTLALADLGPQWEESQAIAQARPDFAVLDRSANDWFAAGGGTGAR
jgi:hypothetical protein